MRPLKRALFPLLLVVASTTAYLYLAEALLSRKDPRRHLPFNGRRNGARYTWGHAVENNRFGFRERDFEVPKPRDTWRVMVLGDSLTWGMGLSRDERYTDILEKDLRDRTRDRAVEVLNFAKPGAPTILEYGFAAKHVDLVSPDLIVLGFCFNDPQYREQDWSEERQQLKESVLYSSFADLQSALLPIYPQIAARLEKAFWILAEKAGAVPSWRAALDRTYDPRSDEWSIFVSALKGISRISKDRNLPPPIFALLNQILDTGRAEDYRRDTDHLFLKWYGLAGETARREGFAVVDFVDEIRGLPPSTSLVVNELDAHPSARLNEIYARKLSRIIAPIAEQSR